MDSSHKDNQTKNSSEKTVNATSHLPEIENYVTPLNSENFKNISRKLEVVMKLFKTKIIDGSSIFIADKENVTITDSYFSNISTTTQYEDLQQPGKKYNFILDSFSFLHKHSHLENIENSQGVQSTKIDRNIVKNILSALNDKGMAMCLMDYHFLIQVPEILREFIVDEKESNVNILTKVYVIEKLPLVGIICIQKFEKSQCDFNNLKLLTYEMYEDCSITKPVSFSLTLLKKSLTYMYEMYQYEGYLSILTSGNVLKICVRENFWSDNVDYTLTIVDSNDPELIKRKTYAAIIVTKSYANDFIYLTQEGNMRLCEQVQASRLILIRPNTFNFDSVEDIKEKISHYITLFRFSECTESSTPIHLMSDTKNENHEIYKENSFSIRDIIDDEKKITFRQLIFNEHQSETQSEIKLILTSKPKAKSDPENYIILPTIEKYKEKHIVSCLDQNYICSFYIKTVLTGIFFVNSQHFPQNNFEVLILGAGIGTINFFFNKLFRSKVNITSVELDKKMPEIGEKYFGFKNSTMPNCKWSFGDAKDFLIESAKTNLNEKKYDMVISDINNFNPSEGISPPPVFFNEEIIDSIKVRYFTKIYI